MTKTDDYEVMKKGVCSTHLRQLHYKVMCIGFFSCRLYVLHGDSFPAVADVFSDGGGKKDWLLPHHTYLVPQPSNIQVLDRYTIKCYLQDTQSYLSIYQTDISITELVETRYTHTHTHTHTYHCICFPYRSIAAWNKLNAGMINARNIHDSKAN